jgi:hypothetical protein
VSSSVSGECLDRSNNNASYAGCRGGHDGADVGCTGKLAAQGDGREVKAGRAVHRGGVGEDKDVSQGKSSSIGTEFWKKYNLGGSICQYAGD